MVDFKCSYIARKSTYIILKFQGCFNTEQMGSRLVSDLALMEELAGLLFSFPHRLI